VLLTSDENSMFARALAAAPGHHRVPARDRGSCGQSYEDDVFYFLCLGRSENDNTFDNYFFVMLFHVSMRKRVEKGAFTFKILEYKM